MAYTVKPLSPETWEAFAKLVEANNGVWGGCWCMFFHPEWAGEHKTAAQYRADKQARVRAGTTHHALVFEGEEALGWCQYGPPAELPRIKNRAAYEKGLGALPDWRITCFFVGRGHRGAGVAAAALDGALAQIAGAGGGTVEAYPEDTAGRKVANAFLYTGVLSQFEARGFARDRQIGKHRWVVRKLLG